MRAAMSVLPGAIQRPFVTYDGHHLALFDWPLPPGQSARALVLVLHGLGEHAWRYDALATCLNGAGYAVRAYDQRGHGSSAGRRGVMPDDDTLVRDLAEVFSDTQRIYCRNRETPVVLLGHDLGGLVAATWAQQHQVLSGQRVSGVDGMVLSTPLLAPRMNAALRVLLATCPPWLGDATLSGLPGAPEVFGTHAGPDTQRIDPLCHDAVSARLSRFVMQAGQTLLEAASQWRTPLLLLELPDGQACAASETRRQWARQLSPQWVRVHELAAGPAAPADSTPGMAETALLAWLDERF